ncbi:hypothetical protein PENTCL1PPCAC_18609, partial [Pristionchus entomophagus]
ARFPAKNFLERKDPAPWELAPTHRSLVALIRGDGGRSVLHLQQMLDSLDRSYSGLRNGSGYPSSDQIEQEFLAWILLGFILDHDRISFSDHKGS